MQPLRTTVKNAFTLPKQYTIPSYQRNYVWERETQWAPLWDDLRSLTQERSEPGHNTRPHFLGTIITKDVGAQGFINRWCVIDGQQRLTTLQILLSAVRSVFADLGLAKYASLVRSCLVNQQEAVLEDSDRYKIQHKSSDYEGFSSIIEAGLGTPSEPDTQTLRLHECYAYFKGAVADWLTDPSEAVQDRNAHALTLTLLDSFYVVDIQLDPAENGHAIFESLNARAQPLTEWEKTKNYLLSIAARDDDPDGDLVYQQYLERYDSRPYWNQMVSGTRFSGRRVEFFLFFFAQIELPRHRLAGTGEPVVDTLPRNRLYREFRSVGERVYRRSTAELDGVLQRFNRYACIYRRLDEAGADSFSEYARLVMQRRAKLKLASLTPVFMVLVDKLGQGSRFDQALRAIDSYLMRRVAVKANYSGFDDVAFRFVQVLAETDPDCVIEVLLHLLEKKTTWTSRWPTDDEVSTRLRETDMYHRCAGKAVLLGGIAQRMHEERGDLTMPFNAGEAVTVEHVAPQNWKRHWKKDLRFGDSDEDRHRLNRLVHRIGNLTLVKDKLNHKLGDHPWPRKAKLLGKDNLEMNRRLLSDMKGDVWNEKEIDRRSRVIANYVKEIWPHADALRQELGIVARDDHGEGGTASVTPPRPLRPASQSGRRFAVAGLLAWSQPQQSGLHPGVVGATGVCQPSC